MENLLYIAFWGALVILMMRFGCGAHLMGRRREAAADGAAAPPADGDARRAPALRWVPPPRDRDPVCGETVRTETAKPSVFDGTVYYFCSRDCREAFEAAPALYLAGPPAAPVESAERLEHRHG